jgi:hypothetical protein
MSKGLKLVDIQGQLQDQSLIVQTIKHIMAEMQVMTIWRFLEECVIIKFLVKEIDTKKGYIVLKPETKEPEDYHFRNQFEKLMEDLVMVNIYADEMGVVFRTQKINPPVPLAYGSVCLEIPEEMIKIEKKETEKRSAERILFPENFKHKIRFSKPDRRDRFSIVQFSKDGHDISEGGLSFMISSEESKYFQVDDIIEDLSIFVEYNQISFKSKIVNKIYIRPNKSKGFNYGGWKICLRFTSLTPRDKEVLQSFIFSVVCQTLKGANKGSVA